MSMHHFFLYTEGNNPNDMCIIADAWAGGRTGGREGWVRCMTVENVTNLFGTLQTTNNYRITNALMNCYFTVPYYKRNGEGAGEALSGSHAFIGNIPVTHIVKEYTNGNYTPQQWQYQLAQQILNDLFGGIFLQRATHGGTRKRKNKKKKRKTRKN